jgi:glycosyltransferase involved in cell wall biosynthesis
MSTSREDPMPLVVIEAAAMGMHTVSFENSGGAKVITKNFGTCIPGDPNSKDLHELIKNHKFSKEKNLETARFVKKNYSVTNMIEPVIKIIQKPS